MNSELRKLIEIADERGWVIVAFGPGENNHWWIELVPSHGSDDAKVRFSARFGLSLGALISSLPDRTDNY